MPILSKLRLLIVDIHFEFRSSFVLNSIISTSVFLSGEHNFCSIDVVLMSKGGNSVNKFLMRVITEVLICVKIDK